jgi:hypothetical protein
MKNSEELGGTKEYTTPKPKIIIDVNKHGIRRERFATDPKQYKRMKKRREQQQ